MVLEFFTWHVGLVGEAVFFVVCGFVSAVVLIFPFFNTACTDRSSDIGF